MQRILAIQTKRIGDLILTAPALSLLRRLHPNAHITLVTAGVAGQLASCIPGIDDHLNFDPRRLNLSLWGSLLTDSYDVSFDFNGTDRSVGMSLIAGAEIRAAYSKRALKFPRNMIFTHTSSASLKKLHTIDHMIALLETIAIRPGEQRETLRLQVPQATQEQARKTLLDCGLGNNQSFAIIHPGTARSEKYWNASAWASVAEHLILAKKLQVVITGGNDAEESAHIESIKAHLTAKTLPQVIDLSGKISLPITASIIEQSQVVLGVDTAAMHLASAFNKPQLVLFGPTNPYHWRPLHDQAHVLLAGHDKPLLNSDYEFKIPEASMSLISEEQVIDTINNEFNVI
ncbi:MAG: glycosyltransferase family 9 protein [Verrucomicrobia bacterium]|nr:glycosyltransferase family 9 protein [Verrucomicrobiota bacterium]